jgi:YggT family protein
MFLVANLVDWAFRLYEFLILLRVLFSWIRPDPYNPPVRIVHQLTDPIMEPLRRIIPPVGMMDISPIIALILLSIIQGFVVGFLYGVR